VSSPAIDDIRAGGDAAVPLDRASRSLSTTSNRRQRVLAGAATAILIAIIILVLLRLTVWSWSQPVSFDGAMNLEVARSLAEGNGYRRMYAGHSGFSHEIQTRAPYILPAAAVFRIFGVGIWQAQFVNFVHALALLAAVFFVLRRCASWRWGLFAVAVVACTPGFDQIGMNGYGEVPALAWWFAGLLVLYPREPVGSNAFGRYAGAGILIGIAIVTKTVLLIGLVAILPVFLAERARSTRSAWATIVAVTMLLAAAALPILAHEACRVLALGNMDAWQGWLHDEIANVHMQAGTHAGFSDTPRLFAKVAKHFDVLVDYLQISPWLLALWLFAPFALFAFLRRGLARAASQPLLLTLGLLAFLYLIWWLGLTPTGKAWYRRIFDGIVALEAFVVVLCAQAWRWRERSAPLRRHIASAALIGLVLLQASLAWADFVTERALPSISAAALAADLDILAKLPPDARLYGVGWYSSPVAALYSGRHIADLGVETPQRLSAAPHAFVLLDTSPQNTELANLWLQRYPSELLGESADLRVVRLDTDRVLDPFAQSPVDATRTLGYVDLGGADYPYQFGVHIREGDGWRWVSADAELLLRYSGEASFMLDMYRPSIAGYLGGKRLDIQVWLGTCRLGTIRQDQEARMQWRLPVSACAIAPGQLVRVRLLSDNLFGAGGDRQLAFVAHGAGFDAAAAQP